MATSRFQSSDLRRQAGASPRPKGRENKDTLCRNVLIYGHCRYEDQGCAFNHDQNKGSSSQVDNSKKSLNVESPSFTPASLQPPSKKGAFTSQVAGAASFTPRGLGASTPTAPSEVDNAVFNPATIREFTPGFDINTPGTANGSSQDGAAQYDPFAMSAVNAGLSAAQYNPYADDHAAMSSSSAFYQGPAAFTPLQPLQHHLYAPIGPHRDDLLPYHRLTHDFFIPEKLREELQKKSEAALQVMPNSQLPQLDNYHSLVALDTSHRKNATLFGYPSWVYKAVSAKTGKLYCLRRLEGYRLTNEQAIRSVKEWRKVDSANVVAIHDAFTTRAFGDSSLIFVQDYHPLSKTLVEAHISPITTQSSRFPAKTPPIPEGIIWTYISQIANALKAVHGAGLAARCMDPSKMILTGKNRVRLTACSILDMVHFDARRPLAELQQDDFIQFGRLILCLTTSTSPAHLTNLKGSLEQMTRIYSSELRDTVVWLLTPPQSPSQKGIDEFIRGISSHVAAALDQALHSSDEMMSELYRELENGRIARLMMKLGTVNERHEFDGDRSWSENGERYMLKLFRDYVFHQVDANGHPVLDIGHMIRCLNKLDAGTDERICLTSRDEQTSFLVSYRELKKQLGTAFGELQKGSKRSL